jgi:hypothetical protein
MPPEGCSVQAPTAGDAGAVAELIAACQLADGGRTEMTVEELGATGGRASRPQRPWS